MTVSGACLLDGSRNIPSSRLRCMAHLPRPDPITLSVAQVQQHGARHFRFQRQEERHVVTQRVPPFRPHQIVTVRCLRRSVPAQVLRGLVLLWRSVPACRLEAAQARLHATQRCTEIGTRAEKASGVFAVRELKRPTAVASRELK